MVVICVCTVICGCVTNYPKTYCLKTTSIYRLAQSVSRGCCQAITGRRDGGCRSCFQVHPHACWQPSLPHCLLAGICHSVPCGSVCGAALEHGSWLPLGGRARGSHAVPGRKAPSSLCDLILGVIFVTPFCILFLRSKTPGPAHLQEEGVT